MRLAYLLKKFPRLSETFVLGEILAQERLGQDIHVFSRRAPDDEPRHAELARLRAPCEVLPPIREIDPWKALFTADEGSGELLERIRVVFDALRGLELPRLPSLLAEALFLRERCAELDVGHVHVHFATDAAVTAMILRGLGGPSYSVTAHAKDIYRSTVDPRLLKRIVDGSAFTVTVCDANVDFVRGLIGDESSRRVRRLYNAIDIGSFEPGESVREPGHVLSVGRMVEKKGFHVLVEALSLLRDRGVDFRATLIGDGEEREHIARAIEESGLSERITMLGALDQDGVRAWLARSQVFCLPCLIGEDGNRDALPTVLLEAEAAGLPIVSTPVTGIPEILDQGDAGLIVPERDPAATADALERMLSDAALRERFSAAGRQRALDLFDTVKNSRVLKGWFDEALAGAMQGCESST